MVLKHKFIQFINSNERLSGTHSNFKYKIDLPKDKGDFDRVCILNASLPKSYYLIPKDSYFTLEEGISSVNIYIQEGNYSRRSFQTVLQNLLNNSSPNNFIYAVSYPDSFIQSDTGKYTYTVSNNGGIQPKFIFNTHIFKQMGFNRNSTVQFFNNTLTSTNILKFQSEDIILIHSDLCSNGDNDILHEIYSGSSPTLGSIVDEVIAVEQNSRVLTSSNSGIYNFIITNEDNEEIEFNGLNIVFTVLFYKKDPIFDLLEKYIKYRLLQNN